MHSSYIANKYDKVFETIIRAFQPTVCVELGTLEGYSTIAIARGLRRNFADGGSQGHLNAYDLFDNYLYRHVSKKTTQENIDKEDCGQLSEYITLYEANAFDVAKLYEPNSVHFLHVDLSNTGDTVRLIMEQWDPLMVQGGVICFEGGSEERDQIEWMRTFKAPSIKRELETNKIISEKYVFGTYLKFPSLTCLLKKR